MFFCFDLFFYFYFSPSQISEQNQLEIQMNPATPTRRYAPPRPSSQNTTHSTKRQDPFADFPGAGPTSSIDHHTILSSLAQERADAAEKRELAKQAGSLLRKIDREKSMASNSSVGRDSRASDYSSSFAQNQSQPQQPVSQLKRLQMTMASLHNGGNKGGFDGHDDDEEADQSSYEQDPSAIYLSSRKSSSGAIIKGSPSRTDFNKFLNTSNNADDTNPNNFSMMTSATGGGVGLSNNTAQHILRDMQGLRDSIGRLETHLMSDMKRRVEAHAALQRTVEVRVREIAESAEKRGQDRMVKLHHTLDSLTQRVSKLEDALSVEREKNARLVQELKYHSARGLQDIRQQLEVERNARSERIATASRNFSQDLFRVEEHIAVAKRAREALGEEVQDAIVKANEIRAENEDKLLQSLINDIRLLKGKLDSETREREVGEEQLAGAMADLAQHLQEL